MVTAPHPIVQATKQTPPKPTWPWAIALAGYFLPGFIGLCVWFYLQAIGKPVMSPEWIAGEIPILAIFSLLWATPYLLVAWAAGRAPIKERRYLGMVIGAFLGTILFQIYLFGSAWQNVEAIFMGFFILPVLVFGGTLLGGAIGLLAGWVLSRKHPPLS